MEKWFQRPGGPGEKTEKTFFTASGKSFSHFSLAVFHMFSVPFSAFLYKSFLFLKANRFFTFFNYFHFFHIVIFNVFPTTFFHFGFRAAFLSFPQRIFFHIFNFSNLLLQIFHILMGWGRGGWVGGWRWGKVGGEAGAVLGGVWVARFREGADQ